MKHIVVISYESAAGIPIGCIAHCTTCGWWDTKRRPKAEALMVVCPNEEGA